MKPSIFSKWYVKLLVLCVCSAIIFLIVKSFKVGLEEGAKMKEEQKFQSK